jgi:hypothetical protein
MVIVCLVLALGRHTPLYWPMFKWLPQYGSFRGTTKFAVFAAAFVSVLAAMGFDRLMTDERAPTWPAFVAGALALILGLVWLVLGTQSSQGTQGWWGQTLGSIAESGARDHELFTHQLDAYREAQFIATTAQAGARGALWAALTAAATTVVLLLSTRRRAIAYVLIAVAGLEMLLFARHATSTMTIDQTMPSEWQTALAAAPADARVVVADPVDQNAGMTFGFDNIWGYDPGVLKRYAELMYAAHGISPDEALQYPPYQGLPKRSNPPDAPLRPGVAEAGALHPRACAAAADGAARAKLSGACGSQ